jgi:hypothetical protein
LIPNILVESFGEEGLLELLWEDWESCDVADFLYPWTSVSDALFRSRSFKFENATVTVSIR